jgi:hypothetical protein
MTEQCTHNQLTVDEMTQVMQGKLREVVLGLLNVENPDSIDVSVDPDPCTSIDKKVQACGVIREKLQKTCDEMGISYTNEREAICTLIAFGQIQKTHTGSIAEVNIERLYILITKIVKYLVQVVPVIADK